MIKRPFIIFVAIVSLLVAALVGFIQSERFASIVKEAAARKLPANIGIIGDFSDVSIKLFPPGVSIRHPKVRLAPHNIVNLPAGSTVTAERIDLSFLPFQMFTRDIRVHEVVIVNGDVKLVVGRDFAAKLPSKGKPRFDFHWDDLVKIRADAVSIQNTRLRLETEDGSFWMNLVAERLSVGQWSAKAGPGYELTFQLNGIAASFLKEWSAPGTLNRVRAAAHVNALGVDLDSFSVASPGLDAETSGKVRGNVLDPKSLSLDLDVGARGELARLVPLLMPGARNVGADGLATFKGRLRGNLEKLAETMKVEGQLGVKGLRYMDWKADDVAAEGSWAAAPGGGEISIARATLSSPETPRVGYSQPASGGKVAVGAFKYRLGSTEPFQVPLTFAGAHIHWLVAPAVKAIYPLDFRLNGTTTAMIAPARGWRVSAKLGLAINNFGLDNQKLGVPKPMRRVLKVPHVAIDGRVDVDAGGVRFQELLLSMARTRFKLAGKIDFKNGLDFGATGPVNLDDVAEIAENAIHGQGTLDARVHGPFSRVLIDFDADLQDAYYLRMKLGAFKGRITWDDKPDHLLITQARLNKGQSSYVADGVVDTRADTVSLGVHIPKGDIQDFVQVFSEMTSGLWWFPSSISGPMSGDVKVSGGTKTDKLLLDAQVAGNNWQYLGEKFKTVALRGGYDRGKYYVSEFRAAKQGGSLAGRVSYDQNRFFEWDFLTRDFTLSDFDHFARLDVPIRGRLQISSSGRGREGAIKSVTQVRLDDFAVRGAPMPPSQLSMRTEGGYAQVHAVALGGQGTADLNYGFRPGTESSIKADFKHLDFSPAVLLLNPKLIGDPGLQAYASGSASLSFRSGAIERGTGRAQLAEYMLAKSGAAFQLSHPLSLRIVDGSFEIPQLALRGNQGEATLYLMSHKAMLDGRVGGQLDASIASFFTPAVQDASGVVDLDFAIGGAIKAPTVLGRATFENASARVAALESPFENVSGTLQLRQNVLSVQNIQADLAGGRVTCDGTITLYADRYPAVSLRSNIANPKLKIFPFQFVKVQGGISVRGSEIPYLVDGSVRIDSALTREKIFQQRQGEGLKALRYTPPPTREREGDYPKFRLKIDVKADRGIIVQNDLFDAELKGNLTVVNTLEAPRIVGTVEMIQGRMAFKDRIFQIQSASAVFDNPTVINPSFNLTANSDVNGYKIQLYASGRLDNWKPDFTSTPPLPQAELLSLLAVGMTTDDSRKLNTADRSAIEQGEAGALILHSLDFNRDIQNKTGFEIQMDESVNPQIGTSFFRPQSQAETAAAPRIVVKKQITKNLNFSAGTTVGVGSNNEKEVNAEYKVTPGFSVLGVWDNYDTVDVPENQTSYGMDLKLEKRFK